MKSLIPIVVVLFISCVMQVPAQADDRPSRTEFFAGFSTLRTSYGVERRDPFMPIIVAFAPDQTLHGVNASATRYLFGGLGITADVSANFTKESTGDGPAGRIETKIGVVNVLGGARYKARRKKRVSPFAHALAGIANTRSTLAVSSFSSSGTSSSTDLALALGGGLDVRISQRIGLRLIQADYNPIFLDRRNQLGFGRSRADNLRISFGVLFR